MTKTPSNWNDSNKAPADVWARITKTTSSWVSVVKNRDSWANVNKNDSLWTTGTATIASTYDSASITYDMATMPYDSATTSSGGSSLAKTPTAWSNA